MSTVCWRRLSVVTLSAMAALPAPRARAQAGPPKAVVDAKVVAPFDLGLLQYNISPHGGHFAGLVGKGSRLAVAVDGVAGPAFDEILANDATGKAWIAFSPDGSRSAYVGRQGQELVVIVDGKEMLRVPVGMSKILPPAASPVGISGPGFTPDGKHVFWTLATQKPTPGPGSHYAQFYFDGQPGPRGYDTPNVSFSGSGDRFAYVVANPLNQNQQALIVDGKPAGYPAAGQTIGNDLANYQFTADGLHLLVSVQVPHVQAATGLVDGRPYLRAQGARPYLAPAGHGFVTVVTQAPPGGQPVQFLDVATHKVVGSEGVSIDTVAFSDDGAHWAARVKTQAGTQFVIADGKKGAEYQNVGGIAFTSAGTVAYGARNRNKAFVVVGDQESDGYQMLFNRSHQSRTGPAEFIVGGNRVGYLGLPSSASADVTVVVDGKALVRRRGTELDISPDGSRYAFAFEGGLDLDGTDVPGVTIGTYQRAPVNRIGQGSPSTVFAFSSDGKHVVAFGRQDGTNANGIVVDGKFVAIGAGTPMNPVFTPDSRHLLWMDRLGGDANVSVFVDGTPVFKFDPGNSRLFFEPGYWDMGGDGVLALVAPTPEGWEEVRITPGGDTSVETLLAKAGKGK
jgi:hypothetical protein